MISRHVSIYARRSKSELILVKLRPAITDLAAMLKSGLSLSEAIASVQDKYDWLERYFQIEGDLSSFGLRREFLFPVNDCITHISFYNRTTGKSLRLEGLSQEEVEGIGQMLYVCNSRNGNSREQVPYAVLADKLREIEFVVPNGGASGWGDLSHNEGIVRLQHASFLLQTDRACVVIDPHFVSGYSTELQQGSLMRPQQFQKKIDAVVISHAHTDHYDLPSLMLFPRDTLIIVPKVSEASILCPMMGKELRALGFRNVLEPEWHSGAIQVEDIEIFVLPFYGEQPLRYQRPRDARLRNWGNTYLFRTPHFSAWCLIDSGVDAEGSMIDLAYEVRKRFGCVDAVLSNLGRFFVGVGQAHPFYVTGLGQYWLSLTADQIIRLADFASDLLTLGPAGAAEVCSRVGAKFFLPYAHLWANIGEHPQHELLKLESLQSELSNLRSTTRIVPWRIGNHWIPSE